VKSDQPLVATAISHVKNLAEYVEQLSATYGLDLHIPNAEIELTLSENDVEIFSGGGSPTLTKNELDELSYAGIF
jgi:hypothetical protein